jgi:hypothetical protein
MSAVQKYNQLVEQQRDLTATIQASTNTIVSALASKLKLAEQQNNIQVAEIGISYPAYSTADVRTKIIDEVLRRLEGRDSTQLRDWSTRLAGPGGNLQE